MAQPTCVLLADGSLGSAVQAARLLSADGFVVHVASTDLPRNPLRASRSIASTADIAADSAVAYSQSLLRWMESFTSPDRTIPVIPLSDRLADWLDKTRHLYPKRFALGIPESSALRPLLAKHTSLAVAERAGLHVLPWITVRDFSDLDDLPTLRYPIIVRPSSWDGCGSSYFKQQIFHSGASARSFLMDRLTMGAIMVAQEYVSTAPDSIEFALLGRRKDGTTSIVTGRKRGTSQAGGGVLTWGETSELPDVAAATEAFLQASRFFGPGGIEFIRQGDRLWFIEFNPRLEAIHFLSDLAGVPLLTPLVRELAEEPVPTLPVHRFQRPAAIWIESAWITWLAETTGVRLSTLADSFREYRRHKTRSMALISRTDPGPALAYLMFLTRRSLIGVMNRGKT